MFLKAGFFGLNFANFVSSQYSCETLFQTLVNNRYYEKKEQKPFERA